VRLRPTEPFWLYDRLVLPALVIAAVLVWLVVRLHAGLGGGTLSA
jgi:hypothetical protein